jgi:hypothetical protein
VDNDAVRELKRDRSLTWYIERMARRHFGQSRADREDAIAEAWIRISRQPAGEGTENYKRHGLRAIAAFYQRTKRLQRRFKQITLSEDGDGHPSPAIKELERLALDGDW